MRAPDRVHEGRERGGAAEETFKLLVESVKDYAIFVIDPAGEIMTWNSGAEAIKGYTKQEAVGKNISMFYTPDDRATRRPQRLLQIAAAEGRVEDEGWRVRRDGTRFWADVVLTALRDGNGVLQGFGKVTRDLTARKASEESLRQSEERLRLMIASVQDYALYMLDPNGIVTSWNPGAERIKGYKPSEIVGTSFSRFFPPEDIASGKPARELELAVKNGRFEDEAWRIRKDGTRFWTNVVITPVRDASGQLLGFTKITRDLTARREAENERLRLAQIEEAVRLRDEFLSIASHELRTPLTAMQLQLHVLHARLLTVDEGLANKVDRATRSGDRLSDLIDALLDVGRIATGKLELNPEPFDFAEAVNDVVERVRDMGNEAGSSMTINLSGPLPGTWDRLRVEQVLTNLLSNAIKYAAGTPVTLTGRIEGEELVLEVRDEGPGLPPTAFERIFERFERASAKSCAGLGLGLYIVRQIVEGHGGSVKASNLQPRGACFVVRMPLRRPAVESNLSSAG